MNTYETSSYSVVMFFSKLKLTDYREVYNRLDEFIDTLETQITDIKFKGFFEHTPITKLTTIRKSDYKNLQSLDKSSSFNEARNLNLFCFSSDWSPTTAPQFFVNCYLTSGDFMGNKLQLDSITANSFFLIALRSDVGKFEGMVSFQPVFHDLNGLYGFIFSNANYAYDGKTYLEWAYRNISIRIKDNIAKWHEPEAAYHLIAPTGITNAR